MRQLKIEFPIQVPNTQIKQETEPVFNFSEFTGFNPSPDVALREIYRYVEFYKNKKPAGTLFEEGLKKFCTERGGKITTHTGMSIEEFKQIARRAWSIREWA